MSEHVERTETTGPARRTVSVEEAGQMLGVGRAAAYRAVKRGDLPTIRLGRRLVVPIAALEHLLEHGTAQPTREPVA